MEEKIVTLLNEMSEYLSIPQMKKLQEVVLKIFSEIALFKTVIASILSFPENFLSSKE